MGKSKKGQKGKQNEDFSDNESITDSIAKDIEEPTTVKSREKKKKALSKTYDESDSESIADFATKNSDEPTGGRKKEKKKKGAKNFDGETDIVDKVASLSIEKNDEDEDNEINAKIAPQKNKKEKKRKAKGKDDSDEDIDILTALESKNKKKSQKSLNVLGIDNDDDNENSSSAPQKFSSKMKSVFAMLDVEEPEFPSDDDNDSFSEISVEPIKIPKFEKKKNKKKDKEEEEIDQIILEMDLKPVKKNKKNKQLESDDLSIESKIEDFKIEDDKKGKKSKKSKKTFDLDMEKELEALEIEIKEEKPKSKTKKKFEYNLEEELTQKQEETVLSPEDLADSLVEDPKKSKRKKNREVQENEPKDEESLLKTTAQKKKDKKEKEKIKKYEEKIKLMKEDKSDSYAIQSSAKTEVQPETFFENDSKESTPSTDTIEKDHQDLDLDVEDNKKSDKKKVKKKGDKEEKVKKPGKKQLLLMQEALKKVQEEKERLRLEEEAKIKAAEEAERKRQEQLRIEKEKKELKKQKEKERRERLKAEGRFLTKSQKFAKARAAATLAALRQQGINVPMIGEKRELEDDKRIQDKKKPKKKNDSSEENSLKEKTPDPVEKMEEEIPPSSVQEELAPTDESEKIDEADDVKDNWEEDSESEDDTEEKSEKSKNKENVDLKSDEEEESDSKSNQTESESESETESESESEEELSPRDIAMLRVEKRREEAEKKRSIDFLRSPVVCVLGHVDTGKTKILDKIRRSHVQDGEAGGITQQIGATMVPHGVIREQCKMVKDFQNVEIKYPGLLIIDTPGHESFSNLRSRGSSLCDIAILVVDIMHGLEAQTLESINLLKKRKTPFIVALNKIDRLFDWKKNSAQDVSETIKKQGRNTKFDFDKKSKDIILQFAEQGLNAALYYENPDPRIYISIVPTSAHSGDGMGNLMALIVQLSQNMLAKRLSFSEELQCTVLEVKAIHGLGTTIDVILINGSLKEGDCIIVAGVEGPIVTQVRGLLMPQPLKELRVKNPYEKFVEVFGAQGIKILAKDLEKALAGLQLLRANRQDEIEICKEEVANSLKETLSYIKLSEKGVYVQASTLGSLEALLEFLRTSKIPYSGIAIGPVHKKDVVKASVMLEHESQYAVILAFDVKTERDAEELADNLGVRIFSADIIYHLFNKFTDYQNELKQKRRDEFKHIAVFPCKLRILPQFIFNSRDPIIIGITVEAGCLKEGTPLCVASKEFLEIGTVSTIEANHKPQEMARQGQEVCIKIEPVSGEAPKMYGRHFDHTDLLVSKITRQSIDACKDYFREDLKKADWQLMVELKKLFSIL